MGENEGKERPQNYWETKPWRDRLASSPLCNFSSNLRKHSRELEKRGAAKGKKDTTEKKKRRTITIDVVEALEGSIKRKKKEKRLRGEKAMKTQGISLYIFHHTNLFGTRVLQGKKKKGVRR